MALLLALEVILFAQHRKAIRLLKFGQLHPGLVLRSCGIFHNFASGPITCVALFCRFSKIFSRFRLLVFFFSFKRSLMKLINFFTVSIFSGTGPCVKIAFFKCPSGINSPKYFLA